MRFHLPSLFIGVIAAISFACFVAADRPTLSSGRFALQATPNHVFILDTDTGKVWQKYVTDNSGQTDQDFSLPKLR